MANLLFSHPRLPIPSDAHLQGGHSARIEGIIATMFGFSENFTYLCSDKGVPSLAEIIPSNLMQLVLP